MFDNLKRIFRNIFKPLQEAAYVSEDDGFHSVSDQKQNEKGIQQSSRDAQLRLVFNLWNSNGFAKQLIQLPIDFIVGEEMFIPDFKSKDNKISKRKLAMCSDLIEDFKEKNKYPVKFEKFSVDLSLNGMLLNPCISSDNGDVTIGFIDPQKIDKVITNPYDVTEVVAVKMKSDFLQEPKIFKIVRKKSPFEDQEAEDYDLLEGDAFYEAINNVSNQPEGVSDLLGDVDMIKKLYELIIGMIDSVKLSNLFVVWTKLIGADQTKINEYRKNNPLPERPTNIITNDQVEINLMNTGVRATNSPDVGSFVKRFIVGNFSFPPMWFADGEDANRAIAIEQGTPVYKKLSKRQEQLIGMIKKHYMYVIHSAVRSKEGFELNKDDLANLIIEIKAPEIQIKNLEQITISLEKLTGSLQTAGANQWLTQPTIRKSFINFINMLGFDINVEAEEAALKTEKEEMPEVVNPNLENENEEEKNNEEENKNKVA